MHLFVGAIDAIACKLPIYGKAIWTWLEIDSKLCIFIEEYFLCEYQS